MRYSLRDTPTALSFLFLAAIFFRATSAPIAPVDTWNHWKYGEWIWRHEKLPEREPFSGQVDDRNRPLVDPAWLAEVAGYLVYARAGMEGIALFCGLAEALKTALLLAAFRRLSGSPWLALVGILLVQVGSWTDFGVFRPQVLGEVCWAAVLAVCSGQWLVASEERGDSSRATSYWSLAALPLTLALWANLDASFVVGLLFLAVLLIGRILQGGRDPGRRRLALAVALSAAAACINPYGPSLIGRVLAHDRTAFIQGTFDGQPLLPLATYIAQAFAASLLIVLATLRLSPRRFSVSDGLLLVVFGLGAWFVARLVPWWMTVWPLVLLPHWRAILDKGTRRQGDEEARAKPAVTRVFLSSSLIVSLPCVAAGVALVLASGSGRWLLRRIPRPEAEQVAPGTPVEVADRLDSLLQTRAAHILAPPTWCDYLLWRMPPAGRVFVYDQFDAFPPKHLAAYARILTMRPAPDDWRTLLDRHGVGVVALSAEDPGKELFQHFLHGREPGWQIFYVNAAATELIAERVR